MRSRPVLSATTAALAAGALALPTAVAAPPDHAGSPPDAASCHATADLDLLSEVQGSGFRSPMVGDRVTARAVVTLASSSLGGFFVQEESGDVDDDAETSEGVFVDGDLPGGARVGSTVEVTGEVVEFSGRTQLDPEDVANCGARPSPIEPTDLVLPADDAERERLEGMVVRTTEDLHVTSLFTAYSFGELGLAPEGPLTQPTSAHTPGEEAEGLAQRNANNLLFINDRDEFGFQNAPWFDEVLGRAGDRVAAGVVGALNFSFGDFLVEPLDEFPVIEQVEERPEVPQLAGGNDVGAFNVLNYFNTFGNTDELRGARSPEQFDLQSAKIVEAIRQLDTAVLGLIELENDYEDAVPSVQTLVEQLNADADDEGWDWIVPDQDDLTDEGFGGLGPDAIAQGIIYQPDRATPVGGPATFDIDAGLTGEDTDKNRWPLAQSFDIDGEVVTVVVNHLKSKGSSCEDVGSPPDFEVGDDTFSPLTGNCDLTRQYAVNQLLDWVEDDPTGVQTDAVLIVGDLNSYEKEAPIQILKDAGYVDTLEDDDGSPATFKFDGRYGRLDYVMASSTAAEFLVDDAAVWQANSMEPYGFLYFNEPVDTAETATPYASSDHDPVVVSLSGSSEASP